MKPVITIQGVAASLPVDNISTDIICPGDLLRSADADYAHGLFGPWRYDALGREIPGFVLNRPRTRNARVLVGSRGFGCGSSREQAVWCLQRFGIDCVIAESFGEIFFENALKNGLLPIVLERAALDALEARIGSEEVEGTEILIDVQACTIRARGHQWTFSIDAFEREKLLHGLDDMDMILAHEREVAQHQLALAASQPWALLQGVPA